MKTNKVTEKTKEEQLKLRMFRDVVFIILGVIFMIISVYSAKNKNDNKPKKANKNVTITTKVKK